MIVHDRRILGQRQGVVIMKTIRRFACAAVLSLTVGILAGAADAQEIRRHESSETRVQRSYSLASDTALYPLKPADTSSPRATLVSFLDNVDRAYRVVKEAHRRNTDESGLITSDSVRHLGRLAEELFERSVSTLDLSEIPAAYRRAAAHERTIKLKEILDRIPLPPAALIPGEPWAEEGQEEVLALDRWRVPDTDIVIARVEDRPRQGEYLFTSQTVARLPEFYDRVRELPYRSDRFVSRDFYAFYEATPGTLLPPKWSQLLPAWSNRVFFSQTVWQWIFLAGSLAGVALLLWAAYRTLLRSPVPISRANRLWRWVAFYIIAAGATAVVFYVLDEQVNLTRLVLRVVGYGLSAITVLSLAAVAMLSGRASAETIIDSPKIDPEGVQASYLRASLGMIGFLAAASIVLLGLSRLGIALVPMLAGIGIGGLAIALAARPTIENIIGSFMIFADKPFHVGQRVSVMGQNGTVESIGLRSTRIRLLSGHLTSIPNEKMAAVEIENVARRPYIRRVFDITITYDTPPEKIDRAVEILREILAVPEGPELMSVDLASVPVDKANAPTERRAHPNEAINQLDFPPRVYFNQLNPDSLNIVVYYWYHPPVHWDYLEHAHWINVRIMERFNAEAIKFAFPTQTLHLTADDKPSFDDAGELTERRGRGIHADTSSK
jgi:MscS family membrane protein